jgi:hypothetical protein
VADLERCVASEWRHHLSRAGVSADDIERVASAFVPPGFTFEAPAA